MPNSSSPFELTPHHSQTSPSINPEMGRVAAPARVLHTLLDKELTGCLRISRLNHALPSWSAYVAQGQVQFATGEDPKGDRLAYLLQRSHRQILPPQKQQQKIAKSPYHYLHQCWQAQQISLQELRSLLRLFTQEALVHLLSMPQGRVLFERGATPDPLLISLDLPELVEPLEQQIGQWQVLNERGIFPHGRLSLLRSSNFNEQFRGPLQAISRSSHHLEPQSLLAGQPSLYGIAAQLNSDLLPIAQLMDRAVTLGYLRWQVSPRQAAKQKQGTIACLDHSRAVQQQVRQTLEPLGYRVIGLTHSQQALSILVKERPSLILIDGALAAEEDKGLGHLLRESSLLRHIPLLLLTPHDSLIAPMRAKAAKAQGWIIKPLDEHSLVKAVKRWNKTSPTSQVA